ncbi:MAG: AAA family ATPase, partial [Myxococcota bacterium]
MKKLPIAIQSFKEMRSDNYIYIDKTKHIYNLT